jgi:hypothetical protein
MDQEGDTSLRPEPSGEGTSEPMTAMDVSEDEADEALLKLNEDELRNLQKANSIQCIKGMRLLPKEASRFDISLCRMIYMPLGQHLPMTSRGWRLSLPMDIGLEHLCSMCPPRTRTGRRGL